jgi:hypothetical protein
MPIFMDRHDPAPGITAELVAAGHQRDVENQDKFGVKMRTYWFDHQCGAVYCLIDAPDAAAAIECHRKSHGEAGVPSTIIPVDLAAVEAFLGRTKDPSEASQSSERTMRAVMFTDIVGRRQKGRAARTPLGEQSRDESVGLKSNCRRIRLS